VDNEEELDLKEEPEKTHVSKEYLGKLQYKVSKINKSPVSRTKDMMKV
jgi:hypothetical protein